MSDFDTTLGGLPGSPLPALGTDATIVTRNGVQLSRILLRDWPVSNPVAQAIATRLGPSDIATINGQSLIQPGGNIVIASAGAPAWGGITGTLSDQADLAAALGEKANTDDLGSAAFTASSAYATAAQGALAATAAQPTALNVWTLPQRSAQQTLTDVSGTLTLDFNTTAAGLYVQDVSTLTVALANVPTDRVTNMILTLQHSGSATHAWAWASSIRWIGSTPTVPTAAGSGLFIFQVFPGGFVTGAYREVAA